MTREVAPGGTSTSILSVSTVGSAPAEDTGAPRTLHALTHVMLRRSPSRLSVIYE